MAEAATASTSSSDIRNTASPPPNCAICLGTFDNKCFSDSCMHQFCFTCLLEWSKVKPVCPLCKQPFKSILHNVKSNNEYDEHFIDNRPAENNSDVFYLPVGTPARYFQFRSTFTVDPGGELAIQQILSTYPSTVPITRAVSVQPNRELYPPRRYRHRRGYSHLSSPYYRRSIYDQNLWVTPNPDITGRFRDISPRFYREYPAAVTRLVPWINRELTAICGDYTNENGDGGERENAYVTTHLRRHPVNVNVNVNHLTEDLVRYLPTYHLRSSEIRDLIRGHLGGHTAHFLHELYHFARSPYDMLGYDRSCVHVHIQQYIDLSDYDDDHHVAEPPVFDSNTRQVVRTPRHQVVVVPPTPPPPPNISNHHYNHNNNYTVTYDVDNDDEVITSSDSDVVAVSVTTMGGGVRNESNPIQRPVLDVIEIDSGSSGNSSDVVMRTPTPPVIVDLVETTSDNEQLFTTQQRWETVQQQQDGSSTGTVLPLKIRLKRCERRLKRVNPRHSSSSESDSDAGGVKRHRGGGGSGVATSSSLRAGGGSAFRSTSSSSRSGSAFNAVVTSSRGVATSSSSRSNEATSSSRSNDATSSHSAGGGTLKKREESYKKRRPPLDRKLSLDKKAQPSDKKAQPLDRKQQVLNRKQQVLDRKQQQHGVAAVKNDKGTLLPAKTSGSGRPQRNSRYRSHDQTTTTSNTTTRRNRSRSRSSGSNSSSSNSSSRSRTMTSTDGSTSSLDDEPLALRRQLLMHATAALYNNGNHSNNNNNNNNGASNSNGGGGGGSSNATSNGGSHGNSNDSNPGNSNATSSHDNSNANSNSIHSNNANSNSSSQGNSNHSNSNNNTNSYDFVINSASTSGYQQQQQQQPSPPPQNNDTTDIVKNYWPIQRLSYLQTASLDTSSATSSCSRHTPEQPTLVSNNNNLLNLLNASGASNSNSNSSSDYKPLAVPKREPQVKVETSSVKVESNQRTLDMFSDDIWYAGPLPDDIAGNNRSN